MKSSNPITNPSFRKLFAAQVIALVGTGLSTVGLSLLAYNLAGTNAGAVLGIALACKMIAYVFFAPIVGGLAHRFARNPFLITLDVIRGVVDAEAENVGWFLSMEFRKLKLQCSFKTAHTVKT